MTWSCINNFNPWANISCQNVFASQDFNYPVTIGKGKSKKQLFFGTLPYQNDIKFLFPNAGLTFKCLPEPYSGNPDANVYCLNKNPGKPDPNFDTNPLHPNLYTQKALDNLKHNVSDAFWTENLVINNGVVTDNKTLFESLIKNSKSVYSVHEGAKWQRKITEDIRKVLGDKNPNIFFLEFFPYHSTYGFDFPSYLPSYDYRNSLLEFAMNEDKLIIIMRQEKAWYDIKDRNIGYRLKRYKKKVILKDKQGAWLTRNNMLIPIPDIRCDSLSWNDIIGMM